MKFIRYTLFTILILTLHACQDFNELEKNDNKPNQVPPGLVLNGIQNDMYERPWSLEHRQNQFWCCNYNYYGTNEYWSAAGFNFYTLKNVMKMEEEAMRTGAGQVNPYAALGKFFRAYFYVRMSQRMGDLPLEDALKGLDNTAPKYDSQEEIYVAVLKWLTDANIEFQELIDVGDNTLQGDIYLNNDMAAWQRVVNSFKIRVLISLSKRADDSSIDVKGEFAKMMNDPETYPLMTSNTDNVQFKYNGTTNLYPLNPGNKGFDKNRYNLAETHIGLLTSLKDPRVFVVANPAKKKIADGVSATSFDAFVGASSGESLDNMSIGAQNGEYSYVNQKRYYGSLIGPEPAVQIGYAEQCFNIAEGINRGWFAGDAEEFYVKGIRASMEFFGITQGSTISVYDQDTDAVLGTVTADVTDYLGQSAVEYKGDNADGLRQILEQKYLSLFQQAGQEAYFNFRRTGIPDFLTGPGTGNNNLIPKRWLYPVTEKNNNGDNYNAAVASQFGSAGDNLNVDLWINKD
jgi:Starch-binding associating with outer membrane